MDTPPVVQPSIPPPPPPSPRSGCLGKGCLAAVVTGILLLVLVIAGGWFAFNCIVRTFTAAQAASVQIEQVSGPQMQLAESKMNTLRSAMRNRQETTIQFTAADINALIASDPGFRDARGRAHFAIVNSTVSLDLSVPLTSVLWKTFRSRWFNGHVQFGVSYVDDNFDFDLKSAVANGHDLPRAFFTAEFSRSFNRSFNDSFRRQSSRHRQDVFWRNLKMISVQDDKLIVTTRGM